MNIISIKERIISITPKFIVNIYCKLKFHIIYLRAHFRHKNSFNKKKIIDTDKTTIVFIVYLPQIWNSLKTVFEAAKNMPNVRTYLVVLPNKISVLNDQKNDSFNYFKKMYPDAINAVEGERLFDLKLLKPDFVFRQTPYDEVYPKEYSYKNLAKYTKTCYIPYNYNFSSEKHLKIEYNHNMLSEMFAIFSESISNMNYCKIQKNLFFHDLNVFYLGFPRFDLLRQVAFSNLNCRKKLVFTWIPRWSLDDKANDSTGFFKYKDFLLDYFSNHTNLNLIIRPHPNMFNNFIECGVMEKKDVLCFYKTIDMYPNIIIDDNMDYLETLVRTDVLIADMSSINYEFFLLNRPIIYCGDINDHNEEVKGLTRTYYSVKKKDDMKNYIEMLSSGVDPNAIKREKDVKDIWSSIPKDIGCNIVNKLIELQS